MSILQKGKRNLVSQADSFSCLLTHALLSPYENENIDKLNGRAFEHYLTVQFRHLGYHVTLTSYSHDYGADLVLRKWGKRLLFRQNAMSEMWELRLFRKLLVLLLITKLIGQWLFVSNFTKSARDLAKRNEVELWGRKEMQKKFHIKA